MDTTTDTGDDPLKRVLEQKEDYENHVKNLQHLQEKAEELDGFSDYITVNYEERSEVGSVMLYFEYGDDENYHSDENDRLERMNELSSESEATSEDADDIADTVNEGIREKTFEEFLDSAIDAVKGGEFAEAQKYVNGCMQLVDDDSDMRTLLNLIHYDCNSENEERILTHLYEARDWEDDE